MVGRYRTGALWILLCVCVLVAAAAPTLRAGTAADAPGAAVVSAEGATVTPLEAIPGELIVKLKPSLSPLDISEIQTALASSPGGGTEHLFAELPTYSALLAMHPARTARVSSESLARGDESLLRLEDVYLIRVDPSIDLAALVNALQDSSDVVYVEPNLIVETALVPNDPFYHSFGSWGQPYDDMWALKKLQPEPAWDRATGAGVVVAVSDTGVDYTHVEMVNRVWVNPIEDLNGNDLVDGTPIDCNAVPLPPPSGDFNCIDEDDNGYVDDLRGWDIGDMDNDPFDSHGHGTHVAGTIAAEGNNSTGIVGVAFDARIMPVKFLDSFGSGTIEDGAESILYAAISGADVVNMSWRGYGASQLLHDAVVAAHDLGVVLVGAAGNETLDVEGAIPPSYPEVIAVASLDHLDVPSDFSNFGEGISVSAPGGDSRNPADPQQIYNNILSLKASGNPRLNLPLLTVADFYYRIRGTSMAAPHASGVAALVLSLHPTLSNELVRVVMEVSADDLGTPGFDVETGHGRVNAFEALNLSDLAVTRAELIAAVSAEPVAAPNSPIDVSVRVENAGPVVANSVQIQLFHGDPALGGVLLRQWTASTIGTQAFEAETIVTLSDAGSQELFVVADPLGQIDETSEDNNEAVTTVNVLSFAYVERVIASDAGLTPAGSVAQQQSPSVSANRVVWTDDRHDPAAPEIYLYDLSSATETRITFSPSRKSSPSISGNRIVWLDNRNGPANVFLYDLALGIEIPITTDTRFRSTVRIDGDRIVWNDNRNGNYDVFVYDLGTGGTETQITTDPSDQSIPEIDGDRVVWVDSRGAAADVYSFTLPSGPESPITQGPTSDIFPDVSGNRFVWTEADLTDLSSFGIRVLDLDRPPYLSLIRSGSADWDPAISGTDVAWIRGLAARRVHALDLETRAMTRLTTGTGATSPQADDDRIVWEEYRRVVGFAFDYDIFMAERDPFPAAPMSLNASRDGAHSIRLSWTASPDSDVINYAIYRRTTTQGSFTLVATTSATSLLDTGLVTGRRYYYRVTAIDQTGGESAYSNEDSAVPNWPPPPCRKCPEIKDDPGSPP